MALTAALPPLWSRRVILPVTHDRPSSRVEYLSTPLATATPHPLLPSCLCFPLSISLPHILFDCLTNSSLPLPVRAVIFCCNTAVFLYALFPLMLRLYTTIRFQFHLDSLRIYLASFIPAALPPRHSIHAFSTQWRNPISLLSVLCRGCDI